MTRSDTFAEAVMATLDQELGLVESAIVMVASGAAPAVSVGGLRFGELLIRPARRLAFGAGVSVVPLWSVDEFGADIRIERTSDA